MLSISQSTIKQQIQTTDSIKPAAICLLSTIVIKWFPFNEWNSTANRVFFWNKLDESEPYNMIYDWEKIKYGEDKSNTYGSLEEDVMDNALKIR